MLLLTIKCAYFLERTTIWGYTLQRRNVQSLFQCKRVLMRKNLHVLFNINLTCTWQTEVTVNHHSYISQHQNPSYTDKVQYFLLTLSHTLSQVIVCDQSRTVIEL